MGLAEVDELEHWHFIAPIEQNVIDCYGAMTYLIFMAVFNNWKELAHNFQNVLEFDSFVVFVQLMQDWAAFEVFSDDEEKRRLQKIFEYFYSIWVVHFSQVLNFFNWFEWSLSGEGDNFTNAPYLAVSALDFSDDAILASTNNGGEMIDIKNFRSVLSNQLTVGYIMFIIWFAGVIWANFGVLLFGWNTAHY